MGEPTNVTEMYVNWAEARLRGEEGDGERWGVTPGARTELASVVSGALRLLCMFIAPIAGTIPPQATALALVIVGVMMFGLVRDLRSDNTSRWRRSRRSS